MWMKNVLMSAGVAGFLGLGLLGAGPSTAPTSQPSGDATPINKLCPIQHEEVNPKVTYLYEGKLIGFCCKDCIPQFKKDPAKYMKDLK